MGAANTPGGRCHLWGRCATRGLPCRLSLGAWRGLGPLWTQEPGQHPPPRCSLWGAGGGAGSPERGPMGGAPYILRLVPGAARPGGQEVTAQQGEHPRDPRAHMRACTHAHTHTRTHTRDAVCPSVHPFQVLGPGRRDPVIMARQRQHGGLGSVLTLMGARPAGRGPSRPRASAAGWGRGQQVVSEHGVVPRGAGAGGVLAARRVLLEGHRQVQVLLRVAGGLRSARHRLRTGALAGRGGPTLTSVDVTVSTRSRSSTSCLKVGLCEGAACQHSRMIMYLKETQVGPALRSQCPALGAGLPLPRGGRALTGHACSWPACPCGGLPSAA